jgi:hypothetical protein
MSKFLFFVIWLAAVIAGIAAFNLVIGVFGLNMAVVSLAVFVFFAIYSSFRTQPEEKGSP